MSGEERYRHNYEGGAAQKEYAKRKRDKLSEEQERATSWRGFTGIPWGGYPGIKEYNRYVRDRLDYEDAERPVEEGAELGEMYSEEKKLEDLWSNQAHVRAHRRDYDTLKAAAQAKGLRKK